LAKGKFLNGNKKSIFQQEKKEKAYLKAFEAKSHAQEIQNTEEQLEKRNGIYELSKKILGKGNEIIFNGGKLTEAFQKQYDAAQSEVDEYYKLLYTLKSITEEEEERIKLHQELLTKNKEYHDDLESIGNLIGRNSKEYKDGIASLESQNDIL